MIKTFEEANSYLTRTIPKIASKKYSGEFGLNRAKKLLEFLGNPQNELKVIHIAGTSGKGSTCYIISSLLNKLGFNVGLHLSPHLKDVRERCLINGKLIDGKKYVEYLNDLVPLVERMKESEFGTPTYFEITTALAYYIFFKEKADYVVMETGLGGLYDATNTVEREDKLCVITRIGLDHTRLLGDTLTKIAEQKAGIIGKGNSLVTIKQEKEAEKVLKESTDKIEIIKTPNNIEVSKEGTKFTFDSKDYNISLLGLFQAENCSLALAAVKHLSKRDDFDFDENKIKETLANINFSGRLEIRNKMIFDGAHNPEKMKSLIESLKKIFPNKKFDFLIAFKEGKDYKEMLKHIIPVADKITITAFFLRNQDLPRMSEKPEVIGEVLEELGFINYNIIEDSKKAIKTVSEGTIVTGSIYMLSEVY